MYLVERESGGECVKKGEMHVVRIEILQKERLIVVLM